MKRAIAAAARARRAAAPEPWRASLDRAIDAHRHGDLEAAERLYQDVLRMRIAQPDALHFLGVLAHQRGRSDEAVELITAALAAAPDHPDAHNNLGNIHKECGRLAEAAASYRRALACSPDHHNARANLAVVQEASGDPAQALATCRALLERAPDHAHAHRALGQLLLEHPGCRADVEEAATRLRRAWELDPTVPATLHSLGVALYALERTDEAREVYREWIAREPANPVPRHMLAAMGGTEAPPRAADDYVRETFDRFAQSFDEQLLQNLHYRAPQVLVDALARELPPPAAGLEVLDAGCGTGLCGPLLRPHARRLVGIDLSPGMLEQARGRGGYDELVDGELTAFLERHRAAFDLVASADTLVYFGDLAAFLRAAHAALRPGGWLGFSLEAMDGDGFELGPSGRYRHARGYVESALQAAGFAGIRITAESLRKEVGRPVAGWVVVARRPGSGEGAPTVAS